VTGLKLPSLTAREVIQKPRRAGFEVARQKGSHVILIRKADKRAVVVPLHIKRDIPKGTLHPIIEMVGLSRDEFISL
jgi:predicted RNA binding protein YcfA (HicA-like mRNA interferase family)